jgi:tetratricopeptide (TPR) repeat protein
MKSEWHLSEEQLALLADGGGGESDSAWLREHLRMCPECASAYTDVLRYRAVWNADPSVFRASDDLVALARRVPDRGAVSARREPLAVPSFWRSWAPVLGSAAVVLVLIATWVIWQPQLQHNTGYADVLPPVQHAVELASMEGSIVIPGGESVESTSPQYRAGFVAQNEIITSSLDRLAAVYHDSPHNPDVAHWLISGYLATGQLDNADLFVVDARRRFPKDIRFLVLEALIAYRLKDMIRAERLLQTAVTTNPTYGPALVNLGLVQYENGQWESARRTFETVRVQFKGSPLEQRANALLSGLFNG